MSYSELLQKYFEGELEEGVMQEVLFAELKNNPELRKDFSDHLQLRAICQEDMAGITTPSECTQSIYQQLGFQIPGELVQAESAAAPGGTSYRKPLSYIVTALMSSLITVLVFLYLFNSNNDGNGLALSGANNDTGSGNTIQGGGEQRSVPLMYNRAQQDAESSLNTAAETLPAVADAANGEARQPEGMEVRAYNTHSNSESHRLPEAPYTETRRPMEQKQVPLFVAIGQSAARPAGIMPDAGIGFSKRDLAAPVLGIAGFELPDAYQPRFSVQTRQISSTGSMDVRVENATASFLENRAISLLYNLDEHHSFGLEVGQQRYGMEFTTTIEGRPDQKVRQNPSLTWFGLTYQAKAPGILTDYLTPYTHIVLGGTGSGLMGRAVAGLQWQAHRNVSLSAGFEVSAVSFSTGSQTLWSDNKGFSYGINVRF